MYNSVAQLRHPNLFPLNILRLHLPPLRLEMLTVSVCFCVYTVCHYLTGEKNSEETADRHPGPLLCCQRRSLGPIL